MVPGRLKREVLSLFYGPGEAKEEVLSLFYGPREAKRRFIPSWVPPYTLGMLPTPPYMPSQHPVCR